MISELILRILFPPRCAACGKGLAEGTMCGDCRASVRIARTLFCPVCERPIVWKEARACHPAPFIIGAAGNYSDERLKALVHSLKFQGLRGAAEPLASFLVQYISGLGPGMPDDLRGFVVMPVPLSSRRLRVRGFNQAEEIARIFANKLGLALETHFLARTKHGKPQSETVDIDERRKNIAGSFAVRALSRLGGAVPKNIILIDDVVTTGATFGEAMKPLLAAGARAIVALAAAKA